MPTNTILPPIPNDLATPSPSGLYGCIEDISLGGITGWLVDIAGASEQVAAYIDGKRIATGQLDIWRPDIANKIGEPKSYGFHLAWDITIIENMRFLHAVDYQLVFSLNDVFFVFGNHGKIRGSQLHEVMANTPPRALDAPRLRGCYEQAMGKDEPQERLSGDVKLIAWYLPQYHPIAENDSWWGHGFTEWTNVASARPFFPEHNQPQIPGELGFYDLRLAETRQAQADLAREHGIYGFCYYYYWFQGKRLLDLPLREVLQSGEPDFPFCICWANETWCRSWTGEEDNALISQWHGVESDEIFIWDVIPIFRDPRYIRVGGAPLLAVYRVALMPDPARTAARWREICRENGIPEIHLCAVATSNDLDLDAIGFDSLVQFPPHICATDMMKDEVPGLSSDFEGRIYDYRSAIHQSIAAAAATPKMVPGVMPSWDNTPRRGKKGHIFYGSTPALYEAWLRQAMDTARANLPEGQRFVFINAWNEWGEGAHLEPDRKHGRAWLQATRRALTHQGGWRDLLASIRLPQSLPSMDKDDFVAALESEFSRLQFERDYAGWKTPNSVSLMKPGVPAAVKGLRYAVGGRLSIDHVGLAEVPVFTEVEKEHEMHCDGWVHIPGTETRENTPAWLLLLGGEGKLYHGFIRARTERKDVVEEMGEEGALFSGFDQAFDISQVEKGIYTLGLFTLDSGIVHLTTSEARIEVA